MTPIAFVYLMSWVLIAMMFLMFYSIVRLFWYFIMRNKYIRKTYYDGGQKKEMEFPQFTGVSNSAYIYKFWVWNLQQFTNNFGKYINREDHISKKINLKLSSLEGTRELIYYSYQYKDSNIIILLRDEDNNMYLKSFGSYKEAENYVENNYDKVYK